MSARMRDVTVVTWMLLVLLLCGCSTVSKPMTAAAPYTGDGGRPILIVSRGWHTGIVLAADLLTAHSPVLQERFADAAFLEVGWGDEAYYQSEQVTCDATIAAALVPTSSVVYVVAVPQTDSGYFSNSEVRVLCANEDQARALAAFIAESFARDADGRLMERQRGNYGNSQFYAGSGSFHLLNTCNTWTATGLQRLGLAISPTLKLTADSVMRYLAEHDYASSKPALYEACGG